MKMINKTLVAFFLSTGVLYAADDVKKTPKLVFVQYGHKDAPDGVTKEVREALANVLDWPYNRGISPERGGKGVYAFSAEGPVGCALYTLGKRFECSQPDAGTIALIVVAEKLQRRGIGSAILQCVLGIFRESGIKTVHLKAENAQAFYIKNGFEKEPILYDACNPFIAGDKPSDCRMKLTLPEAPK